MIGGGTDDEISALTDYGHSLGLSFQIWDDSLDISSDEETLGKDIGNDIRNGKKTLIAVYSLQNSTGEDKQVLDEVFGNHNASDDDVKRVHRLFKNMGSIEYAKNYSFELIDGAKKSLDSLKDSEAKQTLLELADFLVKREY